MTSNSPVLVIGAGLAGLVLARSLRKSNIPAIVFEQAAKGRHPGHGLVLQARAYRPLLSLLGIEEAAFRKAVAVDVGIGRNGAVNDSAYTDERAQEDLKPLIRVNKRKLRDLLADGVEIRWDHRLKQVDASRDSVTAEFENGERVSGAYLIAADGVHSVARQQLLPSVKPKVLSYVAINGQRRVPRATYESLFLPAMADSSSISTTSGDSTLALAINDAAEDTVSISYTYSRPAREEGDALFKPDRSKEDASKIPEEFFEELSAFSNASMPFAEIAAPAKAREDKLLSWLMRSVSLASSDIEALPSRVGLLGDAAHAMPIVAGEGGNHAILDGLSLGHALAESLQNGGETEQTSSTYAKYASSEGKRWQAALDQSESNLADLHRASSKL